MPSHNLSLTMCDFNYTLLISRDDPFWFSAILTGKFLRSAGSKNLIEYILKRELSIKLYSLNSVFGMTGINIFDLTKSLHLLIIVVDYNRIISIRSCSNVKKIFYRISDPWKKGKKLRKKELMRRTYLNRKASFDENVSSKQDDLGRFQDEQRLLEKS